MKPYISPPTSYQPEGCLSLVPIIPIDASGIDRMSTVCRRYIDISSTYDRYSNRISTEYRHHIDIPSIFGRYSVDIRSTLMCLDAGVSWEPPGSLLGASWEPPGSLLSSFWAPLVGLLGPSWVPPASWELPGSLWAPPGSLLNLLGAS